MQAPASALHTRRQVKRETSRVRNSHHLEETHYRFISVPSPRRLWRVFWGKYKHLFKGGSFFFFFQFLVGWRCVPSNEVIGWFWLEKSRVGWTSFGESNGSALPHHLFTEDVSPNLDEMSLATRKALACDFFAMQTNVMVLTILRVHLRKLINWTWSTFRTSEDAYFSNFWSWKVTFVGMPLWWMVSRAWSRGRLHGGAGAHQSASQSRTCRSNAKRR